MQIFRPNIIYLFFLVSFSLQIQAQSLVEDANTSVNISSRDGVFTETIKIISNSKKIFILSNNNQSLTMGDFISIALGDNLAARAIVAKVHQGQVGVKIIKIYSLAQWAKLRRGTDVLVIRGDDSAFGKKDETEVAEGGARIKNEEDLFTANVVVEDDLGDFEDNSKRHIKPDNVVSISASYLTANVPEANGGGQERSLELGFSWAYQFRDNFFAEATYGRAVLKNYPANGIATLSNRLIGRIKFNIKGPAYTFFMPYVGFQSVTISSPDASQTGDPTIDREESDALNNLERSGPVAGITVLRRLVPGWFVKADIGTDLIDLGFAIEF